MSALTILRQKPSAEEIVDFTRTIGDVAQALKVDLGYGGDGYRLLSNTGAHGVQEVPHLHIHLVAGRPLGRMLCGISLNNCYLVISKNTSCRLGCSV